MSPVINRSKVCSQRGRLRSIPIARRTEKKTQGVVRVLGLGLVRVLGLGWSRILGLGLIRVLGLGLIRVLGLGLVKVCRVRFDSGFRVRVG